MKSTNLVILSGRIATTPEILDLNNFKICKFQLVTEDRWIDKKTGEEKVKEEVHNIECSDDGVMDDLLNQGLNSYAMVRGNLSNKKWKNQKGEWIEKYAINVNKFGGAVILFGKVAAATQISEAKSAVQNVVKSTKTKSAFNIDDDIPF